MFTNCTGTHISTVYFAYGNTGWAGQGYVCNVNNVCNNQTAWDATYKTCEARLNATVITGNPGFYTNAEVQKLATHEIGHCYSLWHSDRASSVMNNAAVPDAGDIQLVNNRY